jgi:hypothetical protein
VSELRGLTAQGLRVWAVLAGAIADLVEGIPTYPDQPLFHGFAANGSVDADLPVEIVREVFDVERDHFCNNSHIT